MVVYAPTAPLVGVGVEGLRTTVGDGVAGAAVVTAGAGVAVAVAAPDAEAVGVGEPWIVGLSLPELHPASTPAPRAAASSRTAGLSVRIPPARCRRSGGGAGHGVHLRTGCRGRPPGSRRRARGRRS